MEIQQFVQEFGDAAVSNILSDIPEFIQAYPKSAAYSTTRNAYVLTHVEQKKPGEIYLHELWRYAKEKKLKIPKTPKQK
mgnify:FL=1